VRLHLVFCPQFAGIGPPLGMACVGTVLRRAGHEVTYYDLETAMVAQRRALYFRLYDLINVATDLEAVHFVLRPELLVWTLYGDGVDPGLEGIDAQGWATAQELASVAAEYATWLLEDPPEAVLVSSYIGSVFFSMLLARELKRRRPDLPVVFGGPGCGPEPVARLLLATGWLDACVIGEGEETAVELVAALEANSPITAIPGVATLEDGELVYLRRPNLGLETLTTPDFDGLPYPGANLRTYLVKGKRPFLPVSTSRGCTLRCAFCSEAGMWKGFRRRDPAVIVAELEELEARWGIRNFFFNDSLLNSSEAWLAELCDALSASPVDFELDFAYLQARNLSTPTIQKLAEAGFKHVNFGVESGSPGVLSEMGKRTEVTEIRRILKDVVDAGIYCSFGILVNFPGETRDQIWETFDLVSTLQRELSPDQQDSLFCYDGSWTRVEPHSLMYTMPKRFGITIEATSIRIPKTAEHLVEPLKGVLFSWRGDLDDDERRLRATWQEKAIGETLSGGPLIPLKAAHPLADDRLAFQEGAGIRRDFGGPWRIGKGEDEWTLSEALAGMLQSVGAQGLTVREALERHLGKTANEGELKELLDMLEELVDHEVLRFELSPSMLTGPGEAAAVRHSTVGAAASQLGQWPQAVAAYTRAVRALTHQDRPPLVAAVYQGLGLAAYGAQDYAVAADALLRAVAHPPDPPDPQLLRYAISALNYAGRKRDARAQERVYTELYGPLN